MFFLKRPILLCNEQKGRGESKGLYMSHEDLEFYKGLSALPDSQFPKKCSSCGKTFSSVDEFLSETKKVGKNNGLKSSYDDEDNNFVELFRNCTCGSTLLSAFSDRRNTHPQGLKNRELFGSLLSMLTKRGLADHLARAELIKFMNGQSSEVLEKMGFQKIDQK